MTFLSSDMLYIYKFIYIYKYYSLAPTAHNCEKNQKNMQICFWQSHDLGRQFADYGWRGSGSGSGRGRARTWRNCCHCHFCQRIDKMIDCTQPSTVAAPSCVLRPSSCALTHLAVANIFAIKLTLWTLKLTKRQREREWETAREWEGDSVKKKEFIKNCKLPKPLKLLKSCLPRGLQKKKKGRVPWNLSSRIYLCMQNQCRDRQTLLLQWTLAHAKTSYKHIDFDNFLATKLIKIYAKLILMLNKASSLSAQLQSMTNEF